MTRIKIKNNLYVLAIFLFGNYSVGHHMNFTELSAKPPGQEEMTDIVRHKNV